MGDGEDGYVGLVGGVEDGSGSGMCGGRARALLRILISLGPGDTS